MLGAVRLNLAATLGDLKLRLKLSQAYSVERSRKEHRFELLTKEVSLHILVIPTETTNCRS